MTTRLISRRLFLRSGLAGTLGIGAGSGCGTLLYPERIGQPPGPLDWRVVALDALGLLLFFVPGVVAFAVDFINGTIYLPSGYYGGAEHRHKRLVAVKVPRGELNRDRIEQAVSDETGLTVRLAAGEYQTRELANLDEFWSTRDSLAQHAG